MNVVLQSLPLRKGSERLSYKHENDAYVLAKQKPCFTKDEFKSEPNTATKSYFVTH